MNNFTPHSQQTPLAEAWTGRKLGLFLAILAVMLIVTACDQQSSGSSGSEDKAEAKDLPDYVEAEIPVGSAPEMVAAGFGSVWVSVKHEQLVARIDPKTNKVTQEMKVPAGEYAGDVVVAKGSVWSANWDEGSVWRIDPDSK